MYSEMPSSPVLTVYDAESNKYSHMNLKLRTFRENVIIEQITVDKDTLFVTKHEGPIELKQVFDQLMNSFL